MKTHLDESLCLDLLFCALPAEAERELLSHMKKCRPCEELFRMRAAEMERIRLRSPHRGESPATRRPAAAAGGRWSRWWVRLSSAAGPIRRPAFVFTTGAALVAAVALFAILPHGPGQNLAITPAWLPAGSDITRHRADRERSGQTELAMGIAAYDRHELAEAIRVLSAAQTDGNLEPVRLVYLGSALTLNGQPARAIGYLQRLDPLRLPEPWSGEAQWTLLVALRESGRKASADSLLRLLRNRPDDIGRRAAAASPSR